MPRDTTWSNFSIRSRKAWHAIGIMGSPVNSPVTYVFCMNTHTQSCEYEIECENVIRRLQHMHLKVHKIGDIRYNFLIGDDGCIYEGRGWGIKPLLPQKYSSYNDKSLLIAFIGEHSESDLSEAMMDLREKLVNYGIDKNYIHKEFVPVEIFEKIKGPFQHNMHEGTDL